MPKPGNSVKGNGLQLEGQATDIAVLIKAMQS